MAEPLFPRIRVAHPHVRVDASVLGGSPHVAGSRVPVRRLWAWHRGGSSVETLVRRYPNLGPARILDALSFAYDNQDLIEADLAREQELFAETGPTVGARPLSQLALPFTTGPQAGPNPGLAAVAQSDPPAPNAPPPAAEEPPPAKTGRSRRR